MKPCNRTIRQLLFGLTLTTMAGPLAAQSPSLACNAAAGASPTVRAEGLAELVGDVVLTCTGGTPTAAGAAVPQVNLTISLNTTITSRILAGSLTEAFLLFDEPGSSSNPSPQLVCGTGGTVESNPGSGICTGITGTGNGLGVYSGSGVRANIFQGQTGSGSSLNWYGVPLDSPGPSQTRILRFTNLRANASQLGVSSTFANPGVIAFVSGNGATSVAINNPQQTVAYLAAGLTFSQGTADNSAVLSAPVSLPSCTQGPTRIATLRFKEGFAAGFRPQTVATFVNANTSPAPVNQNVPGQSYGSESGFRNGAFPFDPLHGNLGSAGLADYGTRLKAWFSGVPAGVSIWVEAVNSNSSTSLTARLVTSENGAFSAATATAPPNPLVQLTSAGGTVTAVWEVLGAGPFTVDEFDLGVYVSNTGATAANVTVNGNLAAVGTSSAITSIPLFQDVSSSTSLFSLSGATCATLTASPTSLSFSFLPGATAGSSQSLAVGSGSGLTATVLASSSTGGSWLAVSSNSTIVPASITVSANPSGLTPGNYTGVLLISAIGASNALLVNVSMAIQAAAIGPTLTSISPSSGAPGTSVSVTLTGSNFTSASTVNVANPAVAVNGVNFLGPTQIYATFNLAANAAVGATNVTVTTSSGTSNAIAFTITGGSLPTLTGISPNNGAPGTSVTVTLTGTNFSSGATVNVSSCSLTCLSIPNPAVVVGGVSVNSPTQITATFNIAANATAGPAYVSVTTTAGTSSAQVFTITGAQLVVPSRITFTFQGTQVPPPQKISVTSSNGSAVPFQVSIATVTPHGVPWLFGTQSSPTTPAFVTLTMAPNGLGLGTFVAVVNITPAPPLTSQGRLAARSAIAADTSQCPQGTIVDAVSNAPGPFLIAPKSLTFTDSDPGPKKVTVGNTGSVSYEAIPATIPACWLNVVPPLGITGTTPPLDASVTTTGLGPKPNYQGQIAIQDFAGSPNGGVVNVALAVNGSSPQLLVDPDFLPVCYVRGSTAQGPFSVAVKSTGSSAGRELNYAWNVTSGSRWLTATNGTTPNPSSIMIDPTGLDVGDYDDSIRFSSVDASNPAFLSVHLTVSASDAACSKGRFISSLPHIAAGGDFVTELYIANSGNSPASYSINFYDDTGQPLSLPVSTLGTVNNLSGTITGHGPKVYELGILHSSLLSGSARVTADAGITVQTLFRRLGMDNSYYEVAVPMSTGSSEFWIPFDATTFAGNGSQIYTGIAVANLDPVNVANVTCAAVDAAGKQYPNAVVIPSLNPLGHWAYYLFPALSGQVGTLHCTSTTTIGSVGIRALGNSSISSLPIIAIGGQ